MVLGSGAYRIGSSVTVPGKTQKGGQIIPGSVEAEVTADSPGAEYNISPTDFTVPGFKTDPARFAGFYARSKTKMSGGILGTVKVPGDAAQSAARMTLRENALRKIAAEKQSSVPQGYVLFDGALVTKNEPLPLLPQESGMSLVREKISGTVFLLKSGDIAMEIAKAVVPQFDGLPIEIPELKGLRFELLEPQNGSAPQARTIRFMLKGEAEIVWLFDEYKLREALLGKPRESIVAVLSDFPAILRADFVIRPFWSRSFPKNPKKISIEKVSSK
jgi:hypothetical protein